MAGKIGFGAHSSLAFFLVTGLGGTGKAALVYELRKRGCRALDADDVEGLARWRNIQTGEVLDDRPPLPIDFQVHRFAWQDEAMLSLFRKRGDVFLCGGAWNARSFYDCFEHIFVLAPDKPAPRPKPGRKPRAPQPPAEPVLTIEGATAISGTRPIPVIVDEILEKAREVRRPRSFGALLRLIRPKVVRLSRLLEARRAVTYQD